MKRSAKVTIHYDAILHNLFIARKYAPNSSIAAVIKANAYGHNAVKTAQELQAHCEAFAVSCYPEAIRLRDAGIQHEILLLQGHQHIKQLDIALQNNFRNVVHSQQQLDEIANHDAALKLAIKLDTGMHRLGFDPDILDKSTLKTLIEKHPDSWLMTHMACADETENLFTTQQLKWFTDITHTLKSPQSIANSASILKWPETHKDWIRPGIMLYGSSPFSDIHRDTLNLQAAMTFTAPVIAIKTLRAGEPIGYGCAYTCKQETTVAVIACGYADGYPRHAKAGTPIMINNHRATLAGRVSMDMIIAKLEQSDVNIGDTAELWGKQLSIDEIAQSAGTIAYELLCNVGNIYNT